MALSPFRDVKSKTQVSLEAQTLIKEFHDDFMASMSDDLHTATVLDTLETLLNKVNATLNMFKV